MTSALTWNFVPGLPFLHVFFFHIVSYCFFRWIRFTKLCKPRATLHDKRNSWFASFGKQWFHSQRYLFEWRVTILSVPVSGVKILDKTCKFSKFWSVCPNSKQLQHTPWTLWKNVVKIYKRTPLHEVPHRRRQAFSRCRKRQKKWWNQVHFIKWKMDLGKGQNPTLKS